MRFLIAKQRDIIILYTTMLVKNENSFSMLRSTL